MPSPADGSCVAPPLEGCCACPYSIISGPPPEHTIRIEVRHVEECHLSSTPPLATSADITAPAELYDETNEDEEEPEDEAGVLLRAFIAISIYLCRNETLFSVSARIARFLAIRSLWIFAQILFVITGLLAATSIIVFSAASVLCIYEALRLGACGCCELAANFASRLRSALTLLFLEFVLRHILALLVIGFVIALESAILAKLLSTVSYGRFPAATSNWTRRFNAHPEPCIVGRLGGVRIMAFPDTGAAANFMSLEYAQRHKLEICTSATSRVRIGTGAIIETVGTVVLPFRFNGETRDHSLTFCVLKTSTHEVVLGKPFLLLTETLTRRPDRITSRYFPSTAKCGPFARVCLLGSSDFVSGRADGIHANAIMDTGAGVSLISERFAREHGYDIDTDAEYRMPMQFGDRRTAEAVGMVRGVSWTYDGQGRKFSLNAYVLPSLPADLILGYGFLRDTDAFTTQAAGLWEARETRQEFDGALPFHIVRVVDKCSPACEFRSTDLK